MSTSPAITPPPEPARTHSPALSPSRAMDFKQCPLKYRLRTVDRIPEPPARSAVRGTVVHAVLEALYGLPGGERIPDRAAALVAPAWQHLLADRPEIVDVLGEKGLDDFLAEVHRLIEAYYAMEDPTTVDPESCESLIEVRLPDGSPLRGFVDRIDLTPDGDLTVVDYKTGRSPALGNETRALFQLKFYALIMLRIRGTAPTRLRLIYLSDGQILTYHPDAEELLRFERILSALWTAISTALHTGDFPPNRTRFCQYCDYHSLCPEYGGTPPPYPGPPTSVDDPR